MQRTSFAHSRLSSLLLSLGVATTACGQVSPPCPEPPLDACKTGVTAPFVPSTGNGSTHPCAAASNISGTPNSTGGVVWGSTPSIPPFPSVCWHSMVTNYTAGNDVLENTCVLLEAGVPRGFRLGINLLALPSPGDFLPLGSTIGESSSCLIPPGAGSVPTTWQGLARPVEQGVVDLVTGIPLIQMQDLELPFDGATFRLARTRSGFDENEHPIGANTAPAIQDRWWDWTGVGWMASENPLLLIDSKMPDVVGADPPTCWFVPDAHRSIPFQRVDHGANIAPTYEAPPRFRARLAHNGVWANGAWSTRPNQFDIYLYDGQLRYTFAAIYEDVPSHRYDDNYALGVDSPIVQDTCSSYHESPHLNTATTLPTHSSFLGDRNPGFGIPYYALCTRIADQYGHSVEIVYCDSLRADSDIVGTDCVECKQDCVGKGQIKYIKLRSGETTRWTLLYSHRRFLGAARIDDPQTTADDWMEQFRPLFGSNAIDRIYAYEGDIPGSLLAGACLTIPVSDPDPYGDDITDPGEILDPLSSYNACAGGSALPTNWKHQVRYHYDSYRLPPPTTLPNPQMAPMPVPVLLKTSVTTRDLSTTVPTPLGVKNTVYHYADTAATGPIAGNLLGNFALDRQASMLQLDRIYRDQDIGEVLAWAEEAGLDWFDVDKLARWQDVNGGTLEDGDLGSSSGGLAHVLSRAWIQLTSWSGEEWDLNLPSVQAPAMDDLKVAPAYVADLGLFRNDRRPGTVQTLILRESETSTRSFRFNRLLKSPNSVGPTAFIGSSTSCLDMSTCTFVDPLRSMWFHPYKWQSLVPVGTTNTGLDGSPSLEEPRWITIVDEFRDTVDESFAYNTAAQHAAKPGQLSRRVVSINAAGIVLKERKWEYGDNGVSLVSGSGLGEEYRFATIGTLFPSEPDVPPSVAADILPVELRSVGWSAAALANPSQGATDGQIEFYTYAVFANSPTSDVPWSSRIQRVAEGIRKGTGGTDYFTKQYFRSATAPTDIVCDVDFTSSATSLLTALPELTQPPSGGLPYKATHQLTVRAAAVDDEPETERRVEVRMIVGPPRRQAPDSDWYFPVEREWYDERGNNTWSATGLLRFVAGLPATTGSLDPLASLIFTHYMRDELGRAEFTIVDATPGTTLNPASGASVTIPDYPQSSWSRIPATEGLKYTTHFKYDDAGLSDVFFPNGRRWARRLFQIDPVSGCGYTGPTRYSPFLREYVFNDLVKVAPDQYQATSPGEVKDYASLQASGTPTLTRQVEYADLSLNIDGMGTSCTGQPAFTDYWSVDRQPVQLGSGANRSLQSARLHEHVAGTGDVLQGATEINAVSYTHLTLPTNREV